MDARKTMKEALLAITRNENTYGTKKESFKRIAKVAGLIRGDELKFTDKDVCAVMLAVKLIRESTSHKDDNMVDLAGYASIMNELHHEQ